MPKFSSFNAFGSEKLTVGQSHIPVWLGVVGPVPVGGTLDKAYAITGALYGAGTPVELNEKVIKPFISWEVVSLTAGESNDTIIVKPNASGIVPTTSDFIQKVGATFAATGKAAAVASCTPLTSGDNAGCYQIEVLHSATIDSVSAGDAIALSAATAAGSSKSLAVKPNGYLYNDIYFGALEGDADAYTIAATGAVVKFHADGLLVELTPSAAVKAQMAAAVPGVLQVLV
jgi:hypothetical protein